MRAQRARVEDSCWAWSRKYLVQDSCAAYQSSMSKLEDPWPEKGCAVDEGAAVEPSVSLLFGGMSGTWKLRAVIDRGACNENQ